MAEVIGSTYVIGLGMLFASIVTLLTPLACHFGLTTIVFTRVLVGLCLGGTIPGTIAMGAKWIPPSDRSKYMACTTAIALGAAITTPICGYVHLSIYRVFLKYPDI